MRSWAILLGGLTVWAAHFFALYGIGAVFPGEPEARWLVVAVTLPAILAEALILRLGAASLRDPDQLQRWFGRLGVMGAALSLLAVVWQTLPALLT